MFITTLFPVGFLGKGLKNWHHLLKVSSQLASNSFLSGESYDIDPGEKLPWLPE